MIPVLSVRCSLTGSRAGRMRSSFQYDTGRFCDTGSAFLFGVAKYFCVVI